MLSAQMTILVDVFSLALAPVVWLVYPRVLLALYRTVRNRVLRREVPTGYRERNVSVRTKLTAIMMVVFGILILIKGIRRL